MVHVPANRHMGRSVKHIPVPSPSCYYCPPGHGTECECRARLIEASKSPNQRHSMSLVGWPSLLVQYRFGRIGSRKKRKRNRARDMDWDGAPKVVIE